MEVEVGRAAGQETPASVMAEYMVERVTALMVMCGIESISYQKYESGVGSRLHVTIAPFADAPEVVTNQGVVVKDALAQIMSVSNVMRIRMKPSESDLNDMKATWAESAKAAAERNDHAEKELGKESDGHRDGDTKPEEAK